jgi:hypothetical protein
MPARWKTGLALLALSIAGPLRAEPPGAREVISHCASRGRITLTSVSGPDTACVGVGKALDQLGVTALLPSGSTKSLTADELSDLDALIRRYSGSPASEPPASSTLRFLAARLAPPPPPPTWGDRIRGWIREWAAPLRQWLRSAHPEAANSRGARAAFYALIALLFAAIAAALTLELRGTGLSRLLRRGTKLSRPTVGPSSRDPTASATDEPDWTRLDEQPARVLRLLIDALTRSHRLERERHLTCRELEVEARLDTDIERDGFIGIARLAEREVYGPPGSTVIPQDTLRNMGALRARLLAAAGEPGKMLR